ncbi:MAG: DUF3108 domain-containing protein [Deltaproteobacteria bacterium]|nr:DUF3108 domain-containing protein [Deltaproteobacteria bacterium]
MNRPNFGNIRTGLFRFLVASALLLVFADGCYRAARAPGQEGMPPAEASATSENGVKGAEGTASSLPPPEQQASSGKTSPPVAAELPPGADLGDFPTDSPPDSSPASSVPTPPDPEKEKTAAVARPEEGEGYEAITGEEKTEGDAPPQTEPSTPPPSVPPPTPSASDAERDGDVVAVLPEEKAYPQDGPPWAREKEELAYKVEFLGITMGYARFSSLGRVLLSGREAYHLRVRAWTSDLLSLIYPINDTIDYYLDVQTMVPLRLEFTRSRKEDDVATYDQENGTIVYRYRKDGKIRKKVDVLPNVYDPVSLAYYFRTRGLEKEEKELSMYAGRKLWEISAKPVGFERIRTDRGEFDTVIVQPVLRREGKLDERRKMRMWMTKDERHIPIRLYAKFKKIRTWTLVGELLPDQEGG